MSQFLNCHWEMSCHTLAEWVNRNVRRGDIESISGNGDNGYTVWYWEAK